MSRTNSAARRQNVYRQLVLAAAIAAPAALAHAQAVWVGPAAGGLWGLPSNWDTNFTPVGAGAIGRVDGNKPQNTDVLIDGGFTISNIIIDSGDQVRLANGQQIVFNESATTLQQDGLAIAANGTFTVQATSQNTDLNIPGGHNIVFEGIQGNGGGVVNLTNNGGAGSSRITGSGSLTNSITIQGVGQIGLNSLARLTNTGSITAVGGVLSIDPSNQGGTAGMFNSGVLAARSGGDLQLTGSNAGFLDNTGGTLLALDASNVTLVSSMDVRGGTVQTSGSGTVRSGAGHDVIVSNLSVAGNLAVSANSTLRYVGTATNSGSINITGVGVDSAFLNMNGGVTTLNGNGVINLSRTGAGDAQITGGGTLVTSNTIRGAGSAGANSTVIVNNGTIHANTSGAALVLDAPNIGAPAGFYNNNLVIADGGTIQFTGSNAGGFSNAGTITAASSNVELLTSAVLSGGTFSSTGTGVVRTPTGNTAFVSTFTNIGNLTIDPNATLHLFGNVTNNGSINVNSGAAGIAILGTNSTTLSLGGSGVVNLNRTAAQDAWLGASSGTINNSGLVRGAGNVGVNSTTVRNTGTILANNGTMSLVVDPPNLGAPPGFINGGTLLANGGLLQLTGSNAGHFDNTGGRIIAGSTDVELVASVNVSGGTLSSSGAGVIRVPGGHTAFISALTNVGNVVINPNATLIAGGVITNNGSMNVNSGTNTVAQFNTGNGSFTLSGSGSVNMNEAGGGAWTGVGGGTLVLNQTVHGGGNVGVNSTTVINNNVIRADAGAVALTIDPPNLGAPAGFYNNGSLHANGGALRLTGSNAGYFDNNNGRIVAGSNDVELVTSVSIVGGTFTSGGAGVVRVMSGNTAFISNANSTGDITVNPNATLVPGGTLNNAGSINVNAGVAGNAIISANNGSYAISGTGVINMTRTAAQDSQITGGGTLVLGQLVHGSGNVGANSTVIVNNNLIRADSAALPLVIDPPNLGAPAGFYNNGSLQANGGKLQLTGSNAGHFANANGSIIAGSTDVELYASSSIVGGIVTSTGPGVVRSMGGNTNFFTTLSNTGNVTIDPNSTLHIAGTLTNSGSLNVNAGTAGLAVLGTNNGVGTLAGTGAINLNRTATQDAWLGGTGGTFNNSTLVRGSGNVGVNSTFVNNTGTILANNAALGLVIDPPNLGAPAGFNNTGTLVAAGGEMTFTGSNAGHMVSTGTISVASNGTFTATTSGDLRGTSAIINNGTFNQTNSSVTTAKYIRGTGTLNVNTSARFNVTQDGTSTGTSRVSSLNINAGQLDLTDNDMVIDYTGASPQTTVRGYLQSGFNGGSWNGNGLITSLATSNKRIGYAEAAAIFSGFPATFSGQSVDNTSVLIKYTYAGDADLNGVVDFDDYSRTDNGFNNGGVVWSQGDFDYNGVVDFDDYSLIDNAYNTQSGSLRRAMSYLEGGDRSDQGMNTPALRLVMDHFAQFGQPYATGFLNAVPEPTGVLTLAALAAFIAPRRSRRSRAR